MQEKPTVVITKDSTRTARVAPLVLRGGEATDTTRLVLIPQLVVNDAEPSDAVKAVLAHERKRPSGTWEPIESIPLSTLKAGEGVRLGLNSQETTKLRLYLNALHDHFLGNGLVPGQKKYVLVDDRSPALRLQAALDGAGDSDAARVITEWLARQKIDDLSSHIAAHDTGALALDAALGVARLDQFISSATSLMDSTDERSWQNLLATQSWTLSQVYAEPLMFVCEQAYLGGKNVRNQGGTIADFLFRNTYSKNCLIVEIKTPMAPLTQIDKHQRNNSINISADLSGVTQQVLSQRASALREYDMLSSDEDYPVEPISPKLLVIIGRMDLLSRSERENFERYRNNLLGVNVVTFDELVAKVRTLRDLFLSAEAPAKHSG